MEQIRDLLRSRIAQVHDPIQRELLQDVLMDVFGELLAYSESCFLQLEEKIDREFRDPCEHYYIHTGVCKKGGLDSSSRSLFEIPKDEHEKAGRLGTLFLACGYPQVKKCLNEVYHVMAETEQGDYETTVRLEYCSAYLNTFYWLYRLFGANQRQWHTLNCPFLYKMLDVIDLEGAIPQGSIVKKISIDSGELSGYVMNDMALVWNISKIPHKVRAQESAAGEDSFYAHQMQLPDRSAGYLADPEGEDSFEVIFSKDDVLVRTHNRAHSSIDLVKINPMDEKKDLTDLSFPPATNQRNMRHVDRQALGCPRIVWTRGEVERILSSYEAFEDFELEDVRLDIPGEIAGIDPNPFIRTHSFLKQKRKITAVLRPRDSSDIFLYEKMFFLIAELQLFTDEYEWAGVIRQ